MYKKILLFIFISNLAFSASFNCTKATSNVEKMICSDALLSELDSQMGVLYKKASQNTNDKDFLLKSQRIWIKDREKCKDSNCISSSTKNRIGKLENLIGDKIQMNTTNLNSEKIHKKNYSKNNPPFTLEVEEGYNTIWDFYYPLITITSLEDNFKLTNIKINNGKCKVAFEPEISVQGRPSVRNTNLPIIFEEYSYTKARVSNPCKLMKIDIETEGYKWEFKNFEDFFY